MEPTGEGVRSRWITAVALLAAVVLLSVFETLPLVVLPVAVLLVGYPVGRRRRRVALGLALLLLALVLPGGALGALSRGWGLLLGSAFLAASLYRGGWGVLPRALAAVGGCLLVAALLLAVGRGWGVVDGLLQTHFREVSSLAVGDLEARLPGAAWVAELRAATERASRSQWLLFPAMLALQSLAALALASWIVARRGAAAAFRLRPLREFRFNDQLVWVLLAGLVLLALPLDAGGTRAGYNALVFMAGLYALRGVAVFVFLAGGAPSFVSVAFGVLAGIFLYPVVLTAALLVGLGDTWFDVRGRATPVPPT